MKKASSRSQRGSKSIKGKHVLQICVFLGVCIWLICQVKYSHDKEFYEEEGKKSTVVLSEIEDGVVKLGRKVLLPGYQKEKAKHVKEDEDEEEISHGEEEEKEKNSKVEHGNIEEEEEVVEQDDDEEDKNKQGEEVGEETEEENKHEEDETDVQDRDTDKGDESVEEENESDSNGNDEKDRDTNDADEIDMTVDEAREEHYKADDASSAVSHEYWMLNSEESKETTLVEDSGPPAGSSNLQTVLELEKTSDESNHKIPLSADLTNKDFIQDESKNSTSESSLLENITDSNKIKVKENPRSEADDEPGEKESSNLFSIQEEMEALTV